MDRRRALIAKGIVVVCCVAITAMAGWWLGAAYGERRVRSTQEAARDLSEKILATRMVGISIGHPFPSFPVWSADGLVAVESVRDLLPKGGLVVAVSPSCQTCIDVAVALQRACDASGAEHCPAVLLLQGQESEHLREALVEQNVNLPVYCDSELSLFHVHKVSSNPAHFALDTDGIVRYVGAGLRTSDEFAQIIGNAVPFPRPITGKGGE